MSSAAGTLQIRAGRLVDVIAGTVETDRWVFVENGRIVSVSENPQGSSVQMIDLSDHVVLPGMIDCHTHLTLPSSFSDLAGELSRSPAQCAFESIPNARQKLLSGFTTVREAGSYWALVDVALRNAIDAGDVIGPRMFVPGAMLTMAGGAGAMTGISPEITLPVSLRFGAAAGRHEVRDRVRTVVSHGANHIKTFASGAVMQHGCCSPTATEFTLEELEALVDEATSLEVRVMAHAHAPRGIRNAVLAGVVSIEHGTMLDEEGARMMAERGTYLVPTLSVHDHMGDETRRPAEFIAKAREVRKYHDDAFRTALRSGVPVALGSDSVICPHDQGARELHHMVRLGMSPMEALQAATINGAELIGLDDTGSIEAGKLADIIAVQGDPLADIEVMMDVTFVMKAGQVYRGAPV